MFLFKWQIKCYQPKASKNTGSCLEFTNSMNLVLSTWTRIGIVSSTYSSVDCAVFKFLAEKQLRRLTWTVPIVQTGSLKAASPRVTAAICLRAYLLPSQPRCDESKRRSARRDTWQMTGYTCLRWSRRLSGRIMSKRNQFPAMNLSWETNLQDVYGNMFTNTVRQGVKLRWRENVICATTDVGQIMSFNKIYQREHR